MQEFLARYSPPRPDFATNFTEEEGATVGAHFAYLQQQLAAGSLVLAGRTDDVDPMGIAVFRAESAEAAEAWIAADPAVAAGVFRAEIRPFRLALLGA